MSQGQRILGLSMILGFESAFAFRLFAQTPKHQKAVRSRSLSSWRIVYPVLFFPHDLMSWFMVSLTAFRWCTILPSTTDPRSCYLALVWCGTYHWHHFCRCCQLTWTGQNPEIHGKFIIGININQSYSKKFLHPTHLDTIIILTIFLPIEPQKKPRLYSLHIGWWNSFSSF